MWPDIILELICSGVEAIFSDHGGWKARRQRRKEIKAKRKQMAEGTGLIQNMDN